MRRPLPPVQRSLRLSHGSVKASRSLPSLAKIHHGMMVGVSRPTPMEKRQNHLLKNKNTEEKTADCILCGPVRIHNHRGYWSCHTVYTAAKYRNTVRYRTEKYGVDEEEFLRLLFDQHGKCAICKLEMDSPHVDHCHETGVVRGLLCGSCNRAIGLFKDKPVNLLRAWAYLRKERY